MQNATPVCSSSKDAAEVSIGEITGLQTAETLIHRNYGSIYVQTNHLTNLSTVKNGALQFELT